MCNHSFACKVGGQQEPDSPGERESQLLRGTRTGVAIPSNIKDIDPWHSREKSSSSDLVQQTVHIRLTHSQKQLQDQAGKSSPQVRNSKI